ncbi:uncharacterized protein B0H18DRAFT_605635 [Fomitopsis serialis]|uniref:uncharacterized protein n=1 Tax=Fomitopsis serialis TaxID=139415 RepID=UPI0020084A11|nr:uncharacterized protein B0H18DRAFT_605635 [Neoantrodia serialis]KAH9933904.1 hypothetical protein B0H18DRAFT_605635 [Neoantrodia serialis]
MLGNWAHLCHLLELVAPSVARDHRVLGRHPMPVGGTTATTVVKTPGPQYQRSNSTRRRQDEQQSQLTAQRSARSMDARRCQSRRMLPASTERPHVHNSDLMADRECMAQAEAQSQEERIQSAQAPE